MTTKKDALQIIDSLYERLSEYEGGWKDTATLSFFRSKIRTLRSWLPFAHFEMTVVLSDVERLYSARAWQHVAGGLIASRNFVHHSLTSLRMQFERRPESQFTEGA